jgi:hypothetical protein
MSFVRKHDLTGIKLGRVFGGGADKQTDKTDRWQTLGHKGRRTDRWKDGLSDGWTDVQTNGWKDRQTDKLAGRQMEKQKDTQADGCTVKQTNKRPNR